MYTVNDIDHKIVKYTSRKWWLECPHLGRMISEYRYSFSEAVCFFTKDGKYTTGSPDSDDFSYWRDTDGCPIGHIAYDYVFGTLINDNLTRVVEVLNKNIKECSCLSVTY